MKTYLLDASAAVDIYVEQPETKGSLSFLLREQKEGRAALLIPNFCIVEVFKTLAKYRYGDESKTKINEHDYQTSLKKFRDHIHWGKTIYPYDLSRYHIVATDRVIPAEFKSGIPYKVNKKTGKPYGHLSAFDILIIAMSAELAFTRGFENVALLTKDYRLGKVATAIKATPTQYKTPKGPLEELKDFRWDVPQCFDLNSDRYKIQSKIKHFHQLKEGPLVPRGPGS